MLPRLGLSVLVCLSLLGLRHTPSWLALVALSMARGRGGKRGGLRRAQTVTSAADAQDGVQKCVSCMRDVGDDAIGCDECEGWVHNSEMCSGLTQDMIDAIARYSGNGIKFVCTKCRVHNSSEKGKPQGSPDNQMGVLVSQLFQQIKGICSVVQDLIGKVEALSSTVRPPSGNTSGPTGQNEGSSYAAVAGAHSSKSTSQTLPALASVSPDSYRRLVREEVRELDERKKRRCSLVIRGLETTSAEEAARRFSQVTEFLIGDKVCLTDVVRISSANDLFRGKVTDDELRKKVLDSSKKLRDSDRFGSVFIRRDLTYIQRQERARLAQNRADAHIQTVATPVVTAQQAGRMEKPQTLDRAGTSERQNPPSPTADTLPKQHVVPDMGQTVQGGQGN